MNEKVKKILLHVLTWIGAILRIFGILICIASPFGFLGIIFDDLSVGSAIILSINALIVGLFLFQLGNWLEKQKDHKKRFVSLIVLVFLWYAVPRTYMYFN